MKIPRLKYRMNSKIVTIGKRRLVEIMRELQPDKSKKSREEAYDAVTQALNGILNAYAKDLPRGTHLRVRLNDCLSINLCWMVGKAGEFAPYPNLWISAGERLRYRIQAQRAAAYKQWKKDGMRKVPRRTVLPHEPRPFSDPEQQPILDKLEALSPEWLAPATAPYGGISREPITGQGEEKQRGE